MIQEKQSYTDPLIDEVRQRRQELFARYGYDLRRLFEAVRQIEAEHPEKIVDRRKSKRTTSGM